MLILKLLGAGALVGVLLLLVIVHGAAWAERHTRGF
jgi:hypothetical protein